VSAQRVRPLRALLLLAVLVAVAYGSSLRNGFVFDDAIFMERDVRLQSLENARRLFVEPLWGFTDDDGRPGTHQYYRPLQQLPLVVSKVYFDGQAWPAHLFSLVLHALNAFAVYLLLVRMVGRERTALALASVFALHPANSEAVLWAADAAGLGATLCTLCALLIHTGELGAWRSPLLVAPLVLCAAWFKESGVLIPLLWLAYDLMPTPAFDAKRRRAAWALDYLFAVPALASYFALRSRALGGLLPGAGSLELDARGLVINAVALVPRYVATFVWPFDLNMYHDFTPITSIGAPAFLVGMAIVGLLAAAIVMSLRVHPPVACGLLWAAIAAAPYLVVRWPQLNAFAERYLYMPSVGVLVSLGAAGTFARAPRGSTVPLTAAAGFLCLLVAFVAVDRDRARDWHDEVSIYGKTLEQSERAELVRNNLALRYLERKEPQKGIPIQEALMKLDPSFPRGWHNLGLLYLAANRPQAAVRAFERAHEREPGSAATLLNLGYAYDLAGDRDRAVRTYFRTIAVDPTETKAWYNLAVIAFELRQYSNARRAIDQVLARQPGDAAAKTLRARLDAAARAATAPSEDAVAEATLARCQAGRTAAEAGRVTDAIAILNAAAWLDERSPLPHHYLANVYYLRGQYAEALVHQREALQRSPDNVVYQENLARLRALVAPANEATP